MGSKPARPWVERVQEKVDRSAGPTACHPWTGHLGQHGTPTLPVINDKGRKSGASARKVWWEHCYGPCPADRNIFMTCGNRQCINEKHMTLRPRKDPESRFWSKVQKTEGCWIWTGYRNESGYGQFMNTWKTVVQAHRYSYGIATGAPIPEGLIICHRCDNPACVRPDHMFLGTNLDNTRDMLAKGRANHQKPNPKPRPPPFSDETRLTIRDRHAAGVTCGSLAKTYAVPVHRIYQVIRPGRRRQAEPGNGKDA